MAHDVGLRPETSFLLVSGYAKSLTDVGDAFPILQKPFKLGELDRAMSQAAAAARLPDASAKIVRLADIRRS
jgi:hypothetical protein